MKQSTRLPAQWRLPAPTPPPVVSDLSDDAYQFSPMSNDPFAKVGCVKVVDSKMLPQYSPVPNEPQHPVYPNPLINPPERWLRKSQKDPQPMRLIPPLPISTTPSWLDQQVQRQLGTPPIISGQNIPLLPINPKPVKAPDPYRVHKCAANPKPKAPARKKQASGAPRPQGMSHQPILPINPHFLVPKCSKAPSAFFVLPVVLIPRVTALRTRVPTPAT
jgi:hypothetical protein